jgi:F0F1-type ATP synthase alpha subunit
VYAGVRGYLDKLLTSEISKFEEKFLTHLRSNHQTLLTRIRDTRNFTQQDDQELSGTLTTFIADGGFKLKA